MHNQVIERKGKRDRRTDRRTDVPTDRRTDRPTCAKQYTPLFSKGGIIMQHSEGNSHTGI